MLLHGFLQLAQNASVVDVTYSRYTWLSRHVLNGMRTPEEVKVIVNEIASGHARYGRWYAEQAARLQAARAEEEKKRGTSDDDVASDDDGKSPVPDASSEDEPVEEVDDPVEPE